MLRGFTTFVCDKCGHKFEGADMEWNATAFSTPLRCPHCGSLHTRPTSFLGMNRLAYKGIWEAMDEQTERLQAQAETSENNQQNQ